MKRERMKKMLLNQQNALREQIKKAEILAEGTKSEFWKCIKGVILSKMDYNERLLDGFGDLSPDKRMICLQSRLNYRYFLSITEGFAKKKEEYEVQLHQSQQRLKRLEEESFEPKRK